MEFRVLLGLIPLASITLLPTATAQTSPIHMARIPRVSLVVGTDIEGVVHATEQCSSEKDQKPCAPEEFATELSEEMATIVPTFYLDRMEVSNEQYSRCVEAGRCRSPAYSNTTLEFRGSHLPVVLVSYFDATRYCSFVGSRLPTEAEYEAATRGPRRRLYSWGDVFHSRLANAGSSRLSDTSSHDGYHLVAPVNSFAPAKTPQGVVNLTGNVAEWTSSWFGPHGATPARLMKVVKGGSFSDAPVHLRATTRRPTPPQKRLVTVGFRCARSVS